MFKANINDIQTALHDEKCGGEPADDFWTTIDQIEDGVANLLCVNCTVSEDVKDCSNCEPFNDIKEALNKGILAVRAGE